MSLKVSFSGTDKAAEAALQLKASNIVQSLTVKLNSLMIRLQAKIVGEKLDGQVLHHRSGKLSNSIRAIPARIESNALIGSVEGAGGPAWYGKLHETGGTFQVPEYTRRTSAKGEMTRLLTQAKGVRSSEATVGTTTVRAHSITFPQRSFMRTSEQEMHDTITTELKQAADEGLK